MVLEGSKPSFYVLLVLSAFEDKEPIIVIDAVVYGISESMVGRFKKKCGDNVCKPGGFVTSDG